MTMLLLALISLIYNPPIIFNFFLQMLMHFSDKFSPKFWKITHDLEVKKSVECEWELFCMTLLHKLHMFVVLITLHKDLWHVESFLDLE